MQETKMVMLTNGAEEPESLIDTIMDSLKTLMQNNVTVYYFLIMKCRNDNYQIPRDAQIDLIERELLEANGAVRDSVKNVVLSAVRRDSYVLNSPIAR